MAAIDYKQKIKDYMNSSEVDTLYKSMLNNLFPELRESEEEDERIRKHLIGVVELYYGNTDEQEKKDCLAWLEKQGKTFTKKDVDDAYLKGLCLCDAKQELEKQGEHELSEDLGEYITELSKQFPEVSFAKLSRIAVRVAKWQKSHLWKPADGNNLPEIDREVIALTQPYPNDEHLRVVFAHRPNKYTKVWNSDLGEEQVVEIERHGKGEWNIPNVKYWLDCLMPKEIEL